MVYHNICCLSMLVLIATLWLRMKGARSMSIIERVK